MSAALLAFVQRLVERLNRDDIGSYAAALSYNFLFATPPLLLFTAASLAALHLPTLLRLFGSLDEVLPSSVLQLLSQSFTDAARVHSPTLLSVGAIGYLWGMSGVFRQMVFAFNRACEIHYPYRRSVYSLYGLSLLLSLTVGVAMVAAGAVAVIGQNALWWVLLSGFGVHLQGHWIPDIARWLALVIAFVVTTSILYAVVPDQPKPYRLLSYGNLVALILWLVASLGFSLYSQHFGRFGPFYGLLGAMILLLLYLFLFAFILLLGMEINATVDDQRRLR